MSGTARPEHPPHTALQDLAAHLGVHLGVQAAAGSSQAVVTGITLDSRRVQAGDLYAALPGARAHGADFAVQAAAAGATAVLTDPTGVDRAQASGVPVLVVNEPRALLGDLAAYVYGRPADELVTIGVTGTQGKTTLTRLLDGGLLAAGVRSAVVGTVGTRIVGEEVATALTTPEAPDLHGLFARMRECEVTACALEVSSHALVLGRVDGVRFDVAVFTNLGRDHLDFHQDMEHYYAAKASLFTPERARRGLVCIDDEHGRRLAAEAPIEIRTYSLSGDESADWTVAEVTAEADGSTFTVRGPGGAEVRAMAPLPGLFNVANTLAAIAASAEAGLDAQAVADGIAASPGVPGRLERVATTAPFTVVVDYAHKPDAVDAVLRTLRPVTTGQLVMVIGAGGDRDRGKRPLMGQIAAELADRVIVTDDNPRTEDPSTIRQEVLAGARAGSADLLEVAGRRAAIARALNDAGPGDVVVIAGKGHESGQEINAVVHPFDDRQVAREVLAEREESAR
ncbi:MAG: UDP-N-acetylmuramoyl-L-alanyl-D-glutamate--2,6-diaminopimelate ligase [Nocardioidaceae bacterium]|nr:UDP-N-acetylmuramoyl-L-alanyl-D-glutamate--2,6-diaminopimelate ligase [Nocardioidaceae bacterium]